MPLAWIPAISGVFAVLDWVAVGRRQRLLEWICKPAVMVMLVWWAVALTPESEAQRAWFVAALVLSLAGDVFLMLPPNGRFTAGLAAFLLAHLCFIPGLSLEGVDKGSGGFAALLVGLLARFVGGRIVGSVSERLRRAVTAYIVVISLMVVFAFASQDGLAMWGAALFYLSDATLAWNKFVRPLPYGKLRIIVAYHMAQFLLVWSLVR